MNILLTGYTGNLGPAIAEALAVHRIYSLVRSMENAPAMPHVTCVPGRLEAIPDSLAADTEVIVHAAASTAFRAPLEELREANVEGTRSILAFAERCPRLRKFVHVSTSCVSGTNEGRISEMRISRPAAFVNPYELTKWEAEELVLDAKLPAEIVRLSIVAGSECDGSVRRVGALHHMIYWLWKGLVPMMPGAPETPVDLISTEFAAAVIAAAVNAPLEQHRMIHGCAGSGAPQLGELLECLAANFATLSNAWTSGSIAPPALVDAETFAMFETSVRQSRDALFLRVCDDAGSFVPGLLHPRRYLTSRADAICPAARANWKNLTRLVTRHVIDSRS